jgi:DNA invertase Pin-like site-specific DNA recombinase
MERFGTRLMALNDWGVNSHEGELLKYMKGWMSKGERLKTAERRRRGKLRKAREGRTIGGALQPRYGFKYVRKLRVRQWAMRLTQRRWRTCA